MTDYSMELITGASIAVPDVCWIRQPRLLMFREPNPYGLPYQHGLPYAAYNSMISLLTMDRDQLLEAVDMKEAFEKMPIEAQDSLTSFDVICAAAPLRHLMVDLLTLFCETEVYVDHDHRCLALLREDGQMQPLTHDEFQQLRKVIGLVNLISVEEEKEMKFASAAAKRIFEKLQAGRKKRKQKSDPAMELPNVISVVASKHNSYNLLNIWGLTVWQLYNQFTRLGFSMQVDAYTTKWSVWGSDKFDWTLWSQPLNQTD